MRALLGVAALVVGITGCATRAPAPSPTIVARHATPELGVAPPSAAGIGPERITPGRSPARPAQPTLAGALRPILVDDHCTDRDLALPPGGDPAYAVLDRSYALAPGYAPAELVAASAAGFAGASGSKLVSAVVVDDLRSLREAAAEASLELLIDSAYRSYAAQASTFELWVSRLGEDGARQRTARPGHSEHQLGTALDFSSPGWSGRFGDWAVEAAEGVWMAEHAWEHGFVMSYPAGSEAETCFAYEPWHYRWVGREAAAAQARSGLTLHAYLARNPGP